jgi:hypothetical protein
MKPTTHPGPATLGRTIGWLAALLFLASLTPAARAADEPAAIEKRIADSARYLASDECEGRGLGTKGLDLAADYIAKQFVQYGLKTDLFAGQPLQKFTVTTSTEIGKDNKVVLTRPPAKEGDKPETIDLALGKDFSPISLSGTGTFDLPLVFVGYGITAKKEGFDDYAGVDVAGKAVIVLRHQPQQGNAKGIFGPRDSVHAWLINKVANAQEHKAAGVIFCTDEVEVRRNFAADRKKWQEALDRLAAEHDKFKKVENPAPDEIEAQRKRIEQLLRDVETGNKKLQEEHDPVLSFYAGGGDSRRDFPVVHCRRAVLDRVVKAALNTDLAKLEEQIDQTPSPQSRELTPWRASGRVDVERKQAEIKNVVAVLEGQGPTADETIVVGAHYDHLGYGGRGSLAGGAKAIHYGADDNASGTALLLEMAHALAARKDKLQRRLVFVAFTGEEMGLLGSNHYVQHPLFPLDKTVAMLNLDMVGRLRDDRLIVIGTGTGRPLGELLDKVNQQDGLKLNKPPGGPGPSDQTDFSATGGPVLNFSTGTHAEYHRPSDKFETLNVAGMRRIARLGEELVVALADAPSRPEYVRVAPSSGVLANGKRPFFGSMPDFTGEGPGYVLGGVVKDGPAERAGLRAGDAIVEFGDSRIANLEDFANALTKHKAGDRVPTVVHRGKESLTFEVTLDPPR